eukprot:g20654.t1
MLCMAAMIQVKMFASAWQMVKRRTLRFFDISFTRGSGFERSCHEPAFGKLCECVILHHEVHKQGLVPRFGFIADKIIKRGLRIAGEKPGSGLEKALDAPLQALFREQLHTLSARAADRYEESMAAKPNPVEARRAAEDCFVQGAEGLMRPHSDWSYEDELRDLVLRIADSSGDGLSQDMQLIQEQGKQGQGKHVTLEVIRKLQQQSEAVQREVETRGAFPWKVNWQYFIESSPVGFRGQYNQAAH